MVMMWSFIIRKMLKQKLRDFTFPRQQEAPFLCLADFLKPVESGEMDYVALMVVTAGHGVEKLPIN